MTLQIRAIPRLTVDAVNDEVVMYHDITNPGNPQTDSMSYTCDTDVP